MILSEYLNSCRGGMEVTVFDKDYDIEVYFYAKDADGAMTDKWDDAMLKIATALDVVEINENGVTVNLSELIESKLDKTENLFIENNIDSIMDDIENIFSGNVSERWMEMFADILCS